MPHAGLHGAEENTCEAADGAQEVCSSKGIDTELRHVALENNKAVGVGLSIIDLHLH